MAMRYVQSRARARITLDELLYFGYWSAHVYVPWPEYRERRKGGGHWVGGLNS